MAMATNLRPRRYDGATQEDESQKTSGDRGAGTKDAEPSTTPPTQQQQQQQPEQQQEEGQQDSSRHSQTKTVRFSHVQPKLTTAQWKEHVKDPFDGEIKSLTTSGAVVAATKKLADDLTDINRKRTFANDTIGTLKKNDVARSMCVNHSLNVPQWCMNETNLARFSKLQKEMDEKARAYEKEQTALLVRAKELEVEVLSDNLVEAFCEGGFLICQMVATVSTQ